MALYSPGSMVTVHKTITFDGTAGLGAAGTPVSVFTTTGQVLVVAIVPFCTTLLTEAVAGATLALGITGSTALFIAATNAVDIDANEFWLDTAPDPAGIALPAAMKDIVIAANVIITPATQNTNGGVLDIDLIYIPLSTDGAMVAA